MNPTMHPMLVHFPIALSLVSPILIAWALLQFKKNQETANQIWVMVIIPLTVMAIFSILSVLTGEAGHEVLEKYMDEKPIEIHEEIAEIFAMLVYITAALSYFILIFKGQRRFLFMTGVFVLSLVMMGMAMASGKTGGEVVHKYESPVYMNKAIKEGALENIGKNENHQESEEAENEEK